MNFICIFVLGIVCRKLSLHYGGITSEILKFQDNNLGTVFHIQRLDDFWWIFWKLGFFLKSDRKFLPWSLIENLVLIFNWDLPQRVENKCSTNSFKQSILLLKKINSPNQATLHLSYLNRCRLETVPDNLYIPSVIPYSSITSEHISRIRGISLPVCARCSPRSHPNTRSRRMPCWSRSSLLGRALKKNRRKVMNFPLRFEIGLERRWAINLSSISFSPMISTQWDGKKPTWERDINRFDGLFISRGIVWYTITKNTKFAKGWQSQEEATNK